MVIHLSIHIEASQLRVMLLNIEVISQQIVNKTQQNKTVPSLSQWEDLCSISIPASINDRVRFALCLISLTGVGNDTVQTPNRGN